MGRVVNVAYKLTAGAGASGEVTLYTVEAARILTLKGVKVNFPSGQAFKLELAFFRGAQQIAPNVGRFSGDNGWLNVPCDAVLQSGERLRLAYTNTDTVNPQSCLIVVTGELE